MLVLFLTSFAAQGSSTSISSYKSDHFAFSTSISSYKTDNFAFIRRTSFTSYKNDHFAFSTSISSYKTDHFRFRCCWRQVSCEQLGSDYG
ncbi:hypothetical protein KC19_10G172200 [Ceratodon purpureus]|uniref:Uncharacterized protein n=1 Tax=Ceratodon purpureus TaxID=3225 RepID=A0A8T0GP13_CERPU|nr:hypothetical protein KC19_10G172200 [Ceratodon purpureus]